MNLQMLNFIYDDEFTFIIIFNRKSTLHVQLNRKLSLNNKLKLTKCKIL